MAITGGGTSWDDPFLVTSWAEFLEKCNIDTSTYVEWNGNNGTVDFNDIQPEGFSSTINIKSNIKLKNLTWKNFAIRALKAFTVKAEATKIIMDNFKFLNGQLFHGTTSDDAGRIGALFSADSTYTYGSYTITNSVFTYRQDSASHGGFIKGARTGSKMSSSSLNIKSICAKQYTVSNSTGYLQYHDCALNYDVQAASVGGCINGFLCWISGKLQITGSFSNTSTGLLGNMIFDWECNAPITMHSTNGYGYTCIYNSDKCTMTGSGLVAATTAELSDANALYNKGLPIAR